jgi:uncharacterized protein
MQIYNETQGAQLVKAARNSIELFLTARKFNKDIVRATVMEFTKPHGVFVTLKHYPTNELRGCVGFPRAIGPLGEALIDAAIAAAFEDSRFVSVSKKELNELLVEVSILSSPVLVTGSEKKRLDAIKVGRDGLMVQYGMFSGLLLPIVAVEEKWNKKTFLEETCRKAGLHHNHWLQPNVKLYKFETQLFQEETPNGRVKEVMLHNV